MNGPSHCIHRSRNTLTMSPGRMRYLVACGSLNCNALLIIYSATIVYISALANFRALNMSFCFMLVVEGPRKGI